MRSAVIDTLCRLAEEDPNIWLLTGDLGFSVLETFAERFPDRFINVGVAEQNMAGIAAGLALSGKRVVIYSIVNFATMRCLEQIRNDICAHHANVIIIGAGAGYAYGAQGYTHHGLEDIAIMRALPGLDIAAPATKAEAEAALRAGMKRNGPTYIRLEKDAGAPMTALTTGSDSYGMSCYRNGEDAAIVATGGLVGEAMGAAELLMAEGLSVAVWSCPWLSPFDKATFEMLIQRHRFILTAEEGVASGGLASAAALALAELPPTQLPTTRTRLLFAAVTDALAVPVLAQASARSHHGLDAAGLAARLLRAK